MLVKDARRRSNPLARDFPEHCLLVVAGGSCVLVHVFSSVLTRQTRKREEEQKNEFLSPVRGGGGGGGGGGGNDDHRKTMTNTDLVIEEKRFARLRTRYNIVYVLATFGDWIQGGVFILALYREHGFTMQSIGFIFVLGYASSAFLGTIVASLGDRYGHKVNCVLYGLNTRLCAWLAVGSDRFVVFRESFRGDLLLFVV